MLSLLTSYSSAWLDAGSRLYQDLQLKNFKNKAKRLI